VHEGAKEVLLQIYNDTHSYLLSFSFLCWVKAKWGAKGGKARGGENAPALVIEDVVVGSRQYEVHRGEIEKVKGTYEL